MSKGIKIMLVNEYLQSLYQFMLTSAGLELKKHVFFCEKDKFTSFNAFIILLDLILITFDMTVITRVTMLLLESIKWFTIRN